MTGIYLFILDWSLKYKMSVKYTPVTLVIQMVTINHFYY